jgi:hypothetical protein
MKARKPARAFRVTSSPEALHWQSAPAGKEAKAKKASKTKFTCPERGRNAWGKPDTQLICGACYEDGEGEICLMPAAPGGEAA